jgi:calcineurin-like phosphoesterase family protein
MTIFFTSDTHFGEARILRAAKRPFATIAEHDVELKRRWNETVHKDDEIWHLGDVGIAPGAYGMTELLEGLNGRKHLIIGNNDGPKTLASSAWASMQHYTELRFGPLHCVLSHYAFRTWNQMGKGSIDLHGHSHAMLKELTRQFDVGVDAWDYRPVTLEAMLASRRRGKAKSLAKAQNDNS